MQNALPVPAQCDELAPWGYAPGYYSLHCKDCKQEVMAAKCAWRCEPCARKAERNTPLQYDIEGKHVYVRP